MTHYQKAYEVWERLGDTAGIAGVLGNIGLVYEKQGRIRDALHSFERAVELERRLGHPNAEKHATYVKGLRRRMEAEREPVSGLASP